MAQRRPNADAGTKKTTPSGGRPEGVKNKWGFMNQTLKNDIISRIDLETLFSSRLENLTTGRPEARADCPFPGCDGGQKETLSVNLDTSVYHCFRCGAKGDLFTFHQWATGKDFKAALRDLAAMAGVSVGGGDPAEGQLGGPDPLQKAKGIWSRAEEAPADHPYLEAKGVQNHGLRMQKGGVYDGALIMPLYDIDGTLQTVQFIKPDGEKKLMKGGRKKGHFFPMGGPDWRSQPVLYLCEGYATGSSIQEATGGPVLVCVDAGNLKPVAEAVWAKAGAGDGPDVQLIVCGDHDEHGKGQAAARKAAGAVENGTAVFPDRPGRDFNDMALSDGPEAVKHYIRAAVSVSAMNRAAAVEDPDGNGTTKAQQLIEIAQDSDMFRFEDECCATVKVNGRHETYFLNSTGFKNHLRRRFFERYRCPCKGDALKEAIETLEALSEDQPHKSVFCRVGEKDGALYVDLCNEAWEMVEITADGWKVVQNPDVKFIRFNSMLPLPKPEKSDDGWQALAALVNTKERADFILLASWLVGGFSFGRGYPVLIFYGEHGTAKSTATEMARTIIDPNKAPLRSPPKEERDLMISAKHCHCLSFDNLSGVQPWLSDSLCRIATGGGFAKRSLFSNDEETIISVMKPIVLNGIEDLTGRNDLADRSIVINLDYIPEEARRQKVAVRRDFETALPKILGAIFDAISCAIRNAGNVDLPCKPRMADFAVWVQAAEASLPWEPGEFIEAYEANRAEVFKGATGATVIERALLHFLRNQPGNTWEGTPTDLLEELEQSLDESFIKSPKWPKAANALSGMINRVAASLRASGVNYSTKGKKDSDGKVRRFIFLEYPLVGKTTVNRQPGPEKQAQPPVKSKDNLVDDHQKRSSTTTVNRQPGALECPSCRRSDFWEADGGRKICRTCHPPAGRR